MVGFLISLLAAAGAGTAAMRNSMRPMLFGKR
jgi:hypothetical protein